MKFSYKNQLILTCIITLVFAVLNTVFRNWIFSSIGFGVCGLLWIIHPVLPQKAESVRHGTLIIRLCGVLLIAIGIFTRSYLY